MEITDVRVRLVQSQDARLKAFCTITFDDEFVVRDLKLIDGVNGLFVAMPSRKMSGRCPKCGGKNHFKASFCSDCGAALPEDREKRDAEMKPRLYSDIAHPITTKCRRRIQREVINVFNEEVERSKQPGYKPVELDELDELDDGTLETLT